MKCKTCSHPQLHAIDLALLAENHTLESLSHRFGLSISSLHRHRRHLVEKMRRARERLHSSQVQVSLLKLNGFLDHVQRGVETADGDGDIDRVFKGSHIGSRIINQIGKMEVPLELDTVYRLISSPQWTSQDSLLPTAPQVITGIHQSLVDDAFFPCPDLHIPLIDAEANAADGADDDLDGKTETGGTDEPAEYSGDSGTFLATGHRLPAAAPELDTKLQQLLARLDLTADSGPETTPNPKREISAKLATKTSPSSEKVVQNQEDNQSDKNLAPNPPVVPENEVPPAISATDAPSTPDAPPLPSRSLASQDPESSTTVSETGNREPEPDCLLTIPSSLIPIPCPSNPSSLILDPCPSDPCHAAVPPDSPGTCNPEPKTASPYDQTAARADELFEIAHGYKRHNPPKQIPNRRREEDFRSNSLFQGLKGTFI